MRRPIAPPPRSLRRRRASAILALALTLISCNGGSSSADLPHDLGSGIEGLQFPDVPARFDRSGDQPRAADQPGPSDRPSASRERGDGAGDLAARDAAADLLHPDSKAGPDLAKPDAWKGGPCFYDWANWTCQNSGSTCNAGCGIATLTCTTIWIASICSCSVNGVAKQCPQVAGSGCGRCENAFKNGCCVPP